MRRTGGCDCISELNKQLRKATGDPDAALEATVSLRGDCYPWMSAVYRERRKDGTYKRGAKHRTIIPNYCPFCGRKYERRTP